MKKKYEKPRVMFENFAFNSVIAACDFITVADCQAIEGEDGTLQKPFESPDLGITYVTADVNVCGTAFYCYHVNADPIDDQLMQGS